MLGSFEVRTDDGASADVPGPRLRGLLIALALEPGRVVPKATLVDWIWGEHPPAGGGHRSAGDYRQPRRDGGYQRAGDRPRCPGANGGSVAGVCSPEARPDLQADRADPADLTPQWRWGGAING